MQDGPLNQREDVTVSLDKELIEKMVWIAEIRGTTLSALVRDILGAFCQAYKSGSDWISTGFPASMTADQPARPGVNDDSPVGILHRLARHDELIAALEERISFLELTDGVTPRIHAPVSVHPALQTTFPSEQGRIAEVIDSEAPDVNGISDEALVRIRRPVSPVITSVDLNTLGRISPDQDYSLTEAAALLSISSSTIRKYAKDGRLVSRKIGRTTVFKGQDLLTYLGRTV